MTLIMMQRREMQSWYNNRSLEMWRCRMDTEEYRKGMTRDGAQAGYLRPHSYKQYIHSLTKVILQTIGCHVQQ